MEKDLDRLQYIAVLASQILVASIRANSEYTPEACWNKAVDMTNVIDSHKVSEATT